MDGQNRVSEGGVQGERQPAHTIENEIAQVSSALESGDPQSPKPVSRTNGEEESDGEASHNARPGSQNWRQDAGHGDQHDSSEEQPQDRSYSKGDGRASPRSKKRKHGRSRHQNRHDKTGDPPAQPFYYPYSFPNYPPWPPQVPIQQYGHTSEFFRPNINRYENHGFGDQPNQIQDTNRSWGKTQPQEKPRSEHLDGLVFKTAIRRPYMTLNSALAASAQHSWPDHAAVSETGRKDVQRVLSSKHFKNRDGRFSIELSSDKGPMQESVDGRYQMYWLHMQRRKMDITEFEDVCLNSPDLRGELKYVVLQLFKRIRDKFQKKHLQIDPGTVLRYDGDDSRNLREHEQSAIFLCFPYATLVDRKHRSFDQAQDYSMRSLMQILYPYEPSSGRDRAPVFCKGFPDASRKTMLIPQLWVAIIGSKYVVTCGEADASTIASPTISINKHRTLFGLSTHDLDDATETNTLHQTLSRPGMANLMESGFSTERLPQEIVHHTDEEDVLSRQLSSIHESSGAFLEAPIKAIDKTGKSTSGGQSENYKAPRSETMSPYFDGSNANNTESGKEANRQVSHVETTDTQNGQNHINDEAVPEDEALAPGATVVGSEPDETHPRSSVGNVLNHKDRYVAALQSLDAPEMTDQYFLVFLECMKGLLDLRTRFRIPEIAVNVEIILGLEESVRYAELLRGMCQLEEENKELSGNLAYREAMIKTLGLQDASFEDVLQGLDQAVQEAIELFTNPLPREEFSETFEGAGYLTMFSDLNAVVALSKPRSEIPSEIPSGHDGAYATVKGTPPFLSWAWLRAEFKVEITPERLAAENLLIIMEDIGRTLGTRQGFSFENREEMTYNELESTLSKSTLLSRHNTDNTEQLGSLRHEDSELSSRQVVEPGTSQLGTSLSALKAELNTADVVFQSQSKDIAMAIHEMLEMAKAFVRLFIPQNCEHVVAKRIWGALHQISSTATASLEGHSSSDPITWLIRPLPTQILSMHGIEQPKFPFQNCGECRSGTAYRTVSAAIAHLQRNHSSSLQELAHIQANYRHWIRTEDQVRNEIRNGQHLKLLKICVSYLATLHETAEKIHTGMPQNNKTKLPDYMLPNDLVDCFEATAVFILEAETSLAAIKDEVSSFQHTLGISLDTFSTPIISHALNRLETFGKAALACMARAEKTLALSDPEADILSMGPSGPEFLVSIMCQNLQHKQLVDGIDMEIHELYQSHASKLQYQVNHFPRKRLLRDIQSLQEELSVIQSVNKWQQRTLNSYLRVLDVQSYSAPTAHRVAMFSSESESLKTGLKALAIHATELDALEDRTKSLREQLKQSVEILEEDNGKAILVFTMITTIFLPLSFVTSFFGMNTADIRNTDRNQGFFWAIAMPVTVGIVVMAILLAYQGDKLYDATAQAFHRLRDEYFLRAASKQHLNPGLSQHELSMLPGPEVGLRRHSRLGLKRSKASSVLLT